jgi:cell division protein FtsB
MCKILVQAAKKRAAVYNREYIMSQKRKRLPVSGVAIFAATISLAGYFSFAAVQGEFGLFRRVQVNAQEQDLTRQLTQITRQVAVMKNKTRRLSDNYLDLDLLDERARKVLGLVRADEIVIR